MEGHLRLAAAGYPVISFGTGSLVRLPGASASQPNVYPFNTSSYDQMFKELQGKDERLYESNGILNMLGRNREIKQGPERFQDWQPGLPRLDHAGDKGSSGTEGGVADFIITCEERCWDAVVDDLAERDGPLNRPVHIINIDIKDSHEEALIAGRAIVDLADSLNAAAVEARRIPGPGEPDYGRTPPDFDAQVEDILVAWQERWPRFPCLWTTTFL